MHFDQVEFGHRIRMLRKACNITQDQLAANLNISADHLGKIELGKRGVSVDLLIDISEALGVTLDYLIKGNSADCRRAKDMVRQMFFLLSQIEQIIDEAGDAD